jgi:hypothetical protein
VLLAVSYTLLMDWIAEPAPETAVAMPEDRVAPGD